MTRGEDSLNQFASQVNGRSFDGLIVIEPPNTLDYIAGLHEQGLPVILIDDRGHHPEFPSVVTTNRAGAEAAARHLVANGRRRFAVITGPAAYGATRDRQAGFRTGAGPRLDGRLVVEADFTEQGGYAATERLLATGRPFDGLFAHNDLMAIGAMHALRAQGIDIPGQVAVVGFDDIPLASHTEPTLTTVRQPSHEMGAAAARALLGHLQGRPVPDEPIVLDTSLVVRRSAPA
jgi:LacI family transcriptional regulator